MRPPTRRSHTRIRLAVLAAAALAVPAAGCQQGGDAHGGGTVQLLRPHVVAEHPHDRDAFTQGLEVDGGVLYESTGQWGQSRITAHEFTAPESDGPSDIGGPLARADLHPRHFGEGLTVAGDVVWQLTWQDGIAYARDKDTLEELRAATYDGEGWGLCHDGERLVMSDGTDRLTFRDPATFEALGSVRATRDGQPQTRLNELECVDGQVWANIWMTDEIVRVDPATGAVNAVVDAAGLLPPEDAADADVLNGIAAVPGTDRFLLTGKYWPTVFEVTFVPAEAP